MKKIYNKLAVNKWVPLIVLSGALMIIIIDTTVLNVSIRNILDDLNTNVRAIQWVISAYSLTLAALTITGGRLGDLFGRKLMFKIGAILFAAGSIITSIAPTIGWVIFGNAIVEGIGAALMMPATSSLLISTYKGKDRAIAFAIWGSVASIAAAIGPILGGWLTTNYSWRYAFRINIIVVIFLLLGTRFINEARTLSKKGLDLIGIGLSSLGLVSIVYGLIESSEYGWWNIKRPLVILDTTITPFNHSITPFAIAFGLAILAIFSWYERKRELAGKIPLVSLGLFKNAQFTAGATTTALMAIGQTGLIFAIPIFYQSVLGLDAFHTGIGLLPMSIAIMIGAPSALKLIKTMTPKRVIQLGFVISIIGAGILYASLSVDSTPLVLAPGLFVFGLGMGFGFSQLGNLTLSAISVEQSGEASGVNSTIRQIGSSFGSAIIGAALISTLTSSVVTRLQDSTVIPVQAKSAIIKQVKETGSNIEFQKPDGETNIPPAIKKEITSSIHQATVDGNKVSIAFTGGFSLIALGFSSVLPNIKDLETSRPATITKKKK
ncbi:MFS transporter [Candidatus Saccharibacteria bacterium]|nr:MFS transporter [Candidatus Saccharibacteria bacterium]